MIKTSTIRLRRMWALMLFCICALWTLGQNMSVASMKLTNEVLQAKDQRLDLNGKKCALVRVLLPVSGAGFEGSVMGDVEFSISEYKVYLVQGTKMLYVKCPGYKPLMVTFPDYGVDRVEPGLVYRLDIDLPQTAAMGTPNSRSDNFVMLTINPPTNNIAVKIDGEPCITEGGMVAKLLTAGRHSYSIEAMGYESANGTFEINGNDKTELTVNLVSQLSTLKVSAVTSGCEIWVNGVKKGTNTWTGQLTPGRYLVEGRMEGYKPWETTVELASKANRTIDIPALEVRYGRINFQSRPYGASLSLDGKTLGTSPAVFRDIRPGSHKAVISADGYENLTINIDLNEDGELMIDNALSHVPDSEFAALLRKAEAGDAMSQTHVGDICRGKKYLDGAELRVNYAEAAKWYLLAADQGEKNAQYNLVCMYELKEGKNRDFSNEVKLFETGSKNGSPYAQNALGILYREGFGVVKDYGKAMEQFKLAADQGYANAQYQIGYLYLHGYGVSISYYEATKWFRKAADQEDLFGINNLGYMYYFGHYVHQNYDEALKFFKRAGNKGHCWSQDNLGYMYAQGIGVSKDYKESAKWYKKAADQGHVGAMGCLANMYENGLGVEKDLQKANELYAGANR